MAHRTVGAGQSIATSGTSTKSSAISVKSSVLRLTARDEDVHVAIGTEPTATVQITLFLLELVKLWVLLKHLKGL